MEISEMTLFEIRKLLNECGLSLNDEIRLALSNDNRIGIHKIYQQFCRRQDFENRECLRLRNMQLYEDSARQKGISVIAGVDEAGRGPLAGPVVAAAVILPEKLITKGINDSKKLTPAKREQLYHEITDMAVCWSVGISSVEEIDRINILRASLLAMHRAVQALRHKPEYVLVDAVQIPEINIPQLAIIKGDGLSVSIAAASIIAKVTRDRMMDELDREMPQYGFVRHKGYGTTDHMKALQVYGPSSIHRKTFLKNIKLIQTQDHLWQ